MYAIEQGKYCSLELYNEGKARIKWILGRGKGRKEVSLPSVEKGKNKMDFRKREREKGSLSTIS